MFLKKKTQTTNVLFVLDTSGSMNGIRDETIGMINAQIETLQKEKKNMGEVKASLVLFGLNTTPPISVPFQGVDIDEVAEFTRDTYLPQGMTPMRDGIGRALTLGEELDSGNKNDAVLVVTITDGHENASKEWTAESLATKIKELRDTGRWTFQILGANIDFTNVADFGVERHEFAGYAANAVGVGKSSLGLQGGLATYSACRGMGQTQTKGLDVPDTIPKDIDADDDE